MNKVYIILVNYKKYADSIECFETIAKNKYQKYCIILIDNSPDDISYKNIIKWLNNEYGEVETLFPELVYPLKNGAIKFREISEHDFTSSNERYNEPFIIIKAVNRGFAAANNIALSYLINNAEDDSFIWILNNDTVIDKNALVTLVNFYANGDNYDKLIGSKLMYYYRRGHLQSIAANYNKYLGATSQIGNGELDQGQYDNYKLKPTNYLVGASMFLPVSYLKKVGLLNEEYFLYYEELDWKERATRLNLKFAIESNSIVYHKEGSSIIVEKGNRNNMDTADYYSIINRLKFTKKWHSLWLPIVLFGVFYALIKRLLKGQFKLVKKVTIGIVKVFLG